MTDKSKYDLVHKWIRKTYGKATYCSSDNCNHKSKTYDWALLHNKEIDFNVDNFIQLCRSCHRAYDYTEEMRDNMREKMIGKNKGRKHTEKSKYNMSRKSHFRILNKDKKGKHFEEIYGVEKAVEMKLKIQESNRNRTKSNS